MVKIPSLLPTPADEGHSYLSVSTECPRCGSNNPYDFQVNILTESGFYIFTCLKCNAFFCGGYFPIEIKDTIERLLGYKLIELPNLPKIPLGVI